MRKIILSTIILTIFIFGLYLAIGIVRKIQNQRIVTEKIAQLPAFSFSTLSNEVFNSEVISKGPVLVLYFHPECEHCQWEMGEIFKSQIPVAFSKVLLISSAQSDTILNFLRQFHYSDYPSVIPLVDSSYNFEQYFGSSMVPSSYVYDSDLKLIKFIRGEAKTEAILNLLPEHE
jgi:hypothetical protein